MKKKLTFKTLFENDRFVQLFSLLFAIVCWIAVVIYKNPDTSQPIRQVPVTINMQAENLVEMGLTAIEGADQFVDVTVRGPRTVVGRLMPEDLRVTANVSGISESGAYNLTLTLANSGEDKLQDVELESFSPSTVQVRFDRLTAETYDISPIVRGLSIEAGYVSDLERVSPTQITITGPQVELDKIDKVVIETDLSEPLSRNFVADLPIQLLNAQGDPIDLEDGFLTLEHDTAQLMIRVLKTKVLPLIVKFTNIPSNFPLEELEWMMEMTDDSIELAGPVDIIDTYQEIVLGYIDIKSLTPDDNTYSFDVELPSTLSPQQNINTVDIAFATEDWETGWFYINNIDVENAPSGYDVRLVTTSISNVRVVGKASTLASLTSDDIVAVVDLSQREMQAGQYTYPVKISIPTKGLVWAVGDYSVSIQVTES